MKKFIYLSNLQKKKAIHIPNKYVLRTLDNIDKVNFNDDRNFMLNRNSLSFKSFAGVTYSGNGERLNLNPAGGDGNAFPLGIAWNTGSEGGSKLFIAGNNYVGERDLNFSVVRYGNVMGSRGSVIPFFLNYAKENNYLPITHPEMTRFNILLEDGVKMVTWALDNALGGEIFVPKIPSYYVTDLATAIAPGLEQKIIGIRPGEKIHEMMISDSDSYQTLDIGKYFAILPYDNQILREHYIKNYNGQQFPEGGAYDSGSNKDFLSIDQIKELISQLS